MRTRWSAMGAVVAVAIGSGTLALVAADSGSPSSFVPISPCRLIDTRSTSTVGPRSTPIAAGESLNVQVTGSNGSCVIPSTATAIVINVTAVGPTAASYITLYPADVALPNASNLNFTAGQNPTPNLVTVSLSAGGAIKIFNESGAVNVLGDIAGYYQADTPGLGTAGAACEVGGLAGVIVNGFDHDHNVSSKCFTSMVTTLAGSGAASHLDATGVLASFNDPVGVAIDSVGNIYVADQANNRIRKISVTGVVTTLAGSPTSVAGHLNGLGPVALFNSPFGIAVDRVGNIYVAETGNHVIRKITPAGVVSTLAGTPTVAGFVDDVGAAAQFSGPRGVAVDDDGNVYVADSANQRIRVVTPGGSVSTLAGQTTPGFTNGTGVAAQFDSPSGVAVASDGTVYVADRNNDAIRKISAGGQVTTLAGSGVAGFADGAGGAAQFNGPSGLAVDADGGLYVADNQNNRVRKVTAAGVVSTIAGQASAGFADGVGAAAQFSAVLAITIDYSGTLYVGDGNDRIRRIK